MTSNQPPSVSKNKLFCFGYGYTADYLGHSLDKDIWDIAGTTRDEEKRDALLARGIETFIYDLKHPLGAPNSILSNVTHLLISAPPNDAGDPVYKLHAQHIAQMKNLQWVGYLSTTTVYGDRRGEWVTEMNRPRPTSQRGSRRLTAESQWFTLFENHNVPIHIFRLAGIYGPGRSALDTVRAGMAKRIDKPGQKFNRIHVEDIIGVLQASMANPSPGSIYNVADDLPAPSHEIISKACELLNKQEPPLIPYEQANLAPMARSFYSDCKLVSNSKIKEELGVILKYPSYNEGLKACLDAENYAVALFKGMAK